MLRRVVAVTAAAALTSGVGGCAMHSREPLVLGVPFDEPGYGVHLAQEHVGFDVDLAIALSRYAGYPDERSDYIVAQATEGTRIPLWDKDQTVQVLTRPVSALAREKAFYIGPFLTGRQTYATRTADAVRLSSRAAVRSVCVVAGTQAGTAAARDFPKATVTSRATLSTCLTDLLAGTVDAVTDESPALDGYAGTPPYKGAITVNPGTIRASQYYVGVVKDRPELCRTLVKGLREVIDSGQWAAMLRKDVIEPGLAPTMPAPPALTETTCD